MKLRIQIEKDDSNCRKSTILSICKDILEKHDYTVQDEVSIDCNESYIKISKIDGIKQHRTQARGGLFGFLDES